MIHSRCLLILSFVLVVLGLALLELLAKELQVLGWSRLVFQILELGWRWLVWVGLLLQLGLELQQLLVPLDLLLEQPRCSMWKLAQLMVYRTRSMVFVRLTQQLTLLLVLLSMLVL